MKRIAHIGVAVKNIDAVLPFYTDVLKLPFNGMEVVEDEGVKTAFLSIGESNIELLEPLHDDSPIAKFIAKRGEGIHHVALEVEGDIQETLDEYQEKGVKLIHTEPKTGAHNAQIAFLHPKAANGVLYELCQFKQED